MVKCAYCGGQFGDVGGTHVQCPHCGGIQIPQHPMCRCVLVPRAAEMLLDIRDRLTRGPRSLATIEGRDAMVLVARAYTALKAPDAILFAAQVEDWSWEKIVSEVHV